jgi:eukaryotic-like serine/threonine-protein kinase
MMRELQPGDPELIGPYRLRGRLGAGGMGRVYLGLSPGSDIFSLGAVLAFAATGQGPFGSGSTPALVYRVVHSAPALDLAPAEVRSLIDRCLAKDPARRPTAAGLLGGAAYPAEGWLPEPVTRAQAAGPPTMTAPRPAGTASAPALVPPVPGPPLPGPPLPGPPATAGPGRPPWRSRRLGRWRPLTATLVLSGLVGAGATAAVTMTAGSAPAHAAQSAPRTTQTQTLAPARTPASSVSSSPANAAPQTPSPATATAPAYVPPPGTPPATMTPPPSSSAPSSPTTSPSPSTSSSWDTTPPPPAPGASTSASQAAPNA